MCNFSKQIIISDIAPASCAVRPLSSKSNNLSVEEVANYCSRDIPHIINVVVMQQLANSCNMGTSVLPDMYTRSPRVYISGRT